MVTIEQLFRQAQQAGAAEIYLMAGRKPAARIGGKIKNLDYPELSSTEAEKILLPKWSSGYHHLLGQKFNNTVGINTVCFSFHGKEYTVTEHWVYTILNVFRRNIVTTVKPGINS